MKNLPLPSPLKVGVFTYRCKYGSAQDLFYDGWNIGIHKPHELEILVKGGMAPAVTAETFLHEILHAVYWTAGIPGGDDEESTIRKMAPMLLGVLIENPKLLKWVAAMMKRK